MPLLYTACSVGWFVSLLVREEVLLTSVYERKILFWLEIYDRLRQATAKRTGSYEAFEPSGNKAPLGLLGGGGLPVLFDVCQLAVDRVGLSRRVTADP